jgi:AhpD family alkylhydroperoxidase
MSKYIKYIKPTEIATAQGLTAQVYTQIKREMRIVPEPFTLHSPVPEILAGTWGIFRETMLTGQVRRPIKEAVAASVSESNRCPWCVDAHSIVLHAFGESEAARAITDTSIPSLKDSQILAMIQWASATRTSGAPVLANPPFSSQEAAEVVGIAITFHYLNRMVNILLVETNLPTNALVKSAMKRTLGWLYSGAAHKVYQPGSSLDFLPDAQLPADLVWAAPIPNVAGAFARFAAVVEQAGVSVLSPGVRSLVCKHVNAWQGEDMGISRQWVNRAIDELNSRDRAAARITLLTALASHQVDAGVIEASRTQWPTDYQLVSALAWASFKAARRIGGWLHQASTERKEKA